MICLFILTKLNRCLYVQDKKRQIISRDKLNIFVNTIPINQVTKRNLLGIVIDQKSPMD